MEVVVRSTHIRLVQIFMSALVLILIVDRL